MMRLISQRGAKCVHLTKESFIYQSSEQYLILCLKICNLITKYECQIEELIDFDAYDINESPSNSRTIGKITQYLKLMINKYNRIYFCSFDNLF